MKKDLWRRLLFKLVAGWRTDTLLKKRFGYRSSHLNFVKLSIFTEHPPATASGLQSWVYFCCHFEKFRIDDSVPNSQNLWYRYFMHIKLLTEVNLLLNQPWFCHRNFFKTQGWNLRNWSQNETNASFFKDIVNWQKKWRWSYFSGWTLSEFKNQIKLPFSQQQYLT